MKKQNQTKQSMIMVGLNGSYHRTFNGISKKKKKAEPGFHSKDYTQCPQDSPNPQRDLGSLTHSLGAFRSFQKNSPQGMGKWYNFFPGIGLDNRSVWLKGFCSAGPPLTNFMNKRKSRLCRGSLLMKPMGIYGLCVAFSTAQSEIYQRQWKNKQK